MAETPNHGYNRPDAGAENWDQPLNTNFTDIDADIEIRDAGHPSNDNNYDPTDGAKYLDTASGVVYGADGTTWTATFVLPGYDANASEAKLEQLSLATLTGDITGGTGLTDLTGTGLEISTESLGLTNDSVTVAGNSVSLGGSTGISHADLGGVSVDQHHAKNHDHSEVDISAIPVAGLEQSALTVAGNTVSLGGSTAISHGDLSTSPSDAHHTRPSAGNALADSNNTFDVEEASINHNNLTNGGQTDAHHSRPSAGTGLSDNSNTFDVGAGAYLSASGSEVAFSGAAEWQGEGIGNSAEADGTVVCGGAQNSAKAGGAFVGAGTFNEANGSESVVGGGGENVADGSRATVAGGRLNTVKSEYGTAGGGYFNKVRAKYGTIAGGAPSDTSNRDTTNNVVFDRYGTIGGGGNNRAGIEDDDPISATYATVGGGRNNHAAATYATIAGGGPSAGTGNLVIDNYGTVGGGGGNQAGSNDPDPTNAQFATVAGGQGNTASANSTTVAGGQSNTASANFTTVAGGQHNTASAENATVGGGSYNEALAPEATIAGGGPENSFDPESTNNVVYDNYGTIGGGGNNQAGSDNDLTDDQFATVAGGDTNTASGARSAVGGGNQNVASGPTATVPGGSNNAAEGQGSFAAGTAAKAVDDDAFVWNDGTAYHDTTGDGQPDALSSVTPIAADDPTGTGTFTAGATGGVRFITGSNAVTFIGPSSTGWSTACSRTVKTNVDPIDPEAALEGVEEMEVATWEYTDEDGSGAGTTHIGPMAEGFHDAFDVGSSDEHINSINADGAAFAAIQGLAERLDDAQAELDAKDDRIDDLAAETDRLQSENDRLRERLRALESHVGLDDSAATEESVAGD